MTQFKDFCKEDARVRQIGMEAALNGKTRSDCPFSDKYFPMGMISRRLWMEGFDYVKEFQKRTKNLKKKNP